MSNTQKAQELMAEAKKKFSSKGYFGSLFGGTSHIDEAVECYLQAANYFKMAKKWDDAGQAFCKAAALNTQNAARHDAAMNYVDAGKCYKRVDIVEGINCLIKAIDIYTEMGRFVIAAKHHQIIAEIYETDAIDLERAVEHYELAANYFRSEESNSSANKCLLKVAQYAAQIKNYEKAIQIYQEIAYSALNSCLLKYGAKEYLFKAALCHLCVDFLNAQHAIDGYIKKYPAFQDSREYKLLKTIIEYIEKQNVDAYTEAIQDYDSISRLDNWFTTILLRIKSQINETPDLR